MASEWKNLTLKDSGVELLDCLHKTPTKSKDGYPYLSIPEMKDGEINLSEARLISKAHYLEWTKKTEPMTWDVVVSRRCNPGVSAHVPKGTKFALGQNLVILRSSGKTIYKPFLRWLICSPNWWKEVQKYLNVGAVFDSLKCSDILSFRLPIPPYLHQKAIAHILGTLDDKIELNRRMNETLEAMARALFKSWFVDFDPVIDNALRAGNPIPEELRKKAARRKKILQSGKYRPLPPEITTLFPASFENSEMSDIPKGWEVKSLDQVADYLNGLACQKYPPEEGKLSLPVIKIRELRQGITENTDRATSGVPESYIVEDGDVLFSWSGSLLIDIWTQGKGVLNQHLFKITSENYPRWLYYHWTDHHLKEFQRIAAFKATTMGHIKRHHLADAKCCVADINVMKIADDEIDPLFMLRICNELKVRELVSLRNTILPKLMSGELRVPDAEKMIEEASR